MGGLRLPEEERLRLLGHAAVAPAFPGPPTTGGPRLPSVNHVLRSEVLMTIQEQVLDPVSPGRDIRKRRTSTRPRMNPLHEAAMRLADLGLSKSRSRTKDLVNLLLRHGARTWRASQPETDLRLRVQAPEGAPSVRLRLHARRTS